MNLISWLPRLLLALQMLWLPQAAMAAAYATDGAGKYKNEILWLTWGDASNPLGKKGQSVTNGAKTGASIAVAQGQQLDVSCEMKSISGGSLTSYAPGGWTGGNSIQGDRLDRLYNVGGTAGKNQLVSGVVSEQGKEVSFQVQCSSTLAGKALNLRGFVIADAESMTKDENITSTAEGQWHVIDQFVDSGAGEYFIERQNSSSGRNQIKFSTPSANSGNGGRTAVTFLKFSQPKSTQTMDFSVKGAGKTAIAIGLIVPFADFGDAPKSYGDAMHLIDDINFDDDGIGSSTSAVDINKVGFKLSSFVPAQSKYLGSSGPDSEPASRFSDDALGDDTNGALAAAGIEEDAWRVEYKTISVLKAGQTLEVPFSCRGTGEVSGWIDFNGNGQFDSDEKATGLCGGSSVRLTWNASKDLKPGTTFARLRYSELTRNMGPTGVAEDGEVEDHQITITSPKLQIRKQASSSEWTVGQTDASYKLTVTNTGPVATGPAIVEKPVKVLDLMPSGITPRWSGTYQTGQWSCTYSSQLVSCVIDSGVYLAANGGTSDVVLPVNVLAGAAVNGGVTNYASVGGGNDPENNGQPPSPGACKQSGYCDNAVVTVKLPSVAVSKIAMPANQSKVQVDDFITYTLQVTVTNSATLSSVMLTDTLGAGLEYAGIAANAAGFVEGGNGNVRTFTLAKDAKPGVYAVSYRAKVLKTAVTSVKNKVEPAGGSDPTHPNALPPSCVSCSTEHSLQAPLVTYSKTSNPGSNAAVKAGQSITYTLSVVVERSQTTQDVVLRDTLGAGLKPGVVVANTGFVIGTPDTVQTFTLPAGTAPGTYLVSYTAEVKADAKSADLTNVVTADNPTGGVPPGGSLPSCSASCNTGHVMSAPKIEYSKTTTAVKAQETDKIEYEVLVKVSDAQTTADVLLIDTLGAGLEFVQGSNSGDLSVQAVSASNQITLTLAANKAPGIYRVKYQVVVKAGATDPLTNKVVATGGGGIPTCVGSCETSTPLVTSEVSYSKAVRTASTPVKVGDLLTFTLSVSVKSGKTLGALTLVDTLGKGLEFDSVPTWANGNWTASTSGKTLTVQIPEELPASTTPYLFTYTAKVTDQASEFVKNAVVGSGYDNPSCAINCATETPVAKPLVSFTKTSTATSVKVGATIPYVLTATVTNSSLTEAVSSLVDNLSQGLEFVAVTSAGSFSYAINGSSMMVTLPKGTAPGTYTIGYDARVTAAALTSVNNKVEGVPTSDGSTPICGLGSCSVNTGVIREIDAVDDPLPPVKSNTGSPYAGNAYDNDTLNGVPVELGKITGKVLTPATPINGGSVPVLDVATGIVSVPPGTPAGDYSIVYQICDKLAPTVCDTATITIKVTASPIDAKDDSYTGNRGSGGDQEVGNAYSENDTLDGTPFTPDRITGTVTTLAQPIGGDSRVPVLDVVTGKVTVPSGTPAGDYAIHYRICEKLNPSNCDDAVIKVTVKPDESLLRIVKTAAVRTVKIGDLVRYSLQVQNIGAVKVVNANVIDTAANGFTFVNGSMSAVGLGSAVTSSGVRPVQFSGVTLDVGQTGTIVYMMRVGAGVRPGNHINTAFARNGLGDSISNQATASVELVSDPLLDDSLIFGTVFDDRDRDGWQDSAKLTGLKAQGGFAPAAYIANSTTVEKGEGAEPQADASSPLLHGLNLGSITARQSEADPVAKHTVVIHQKLKSLDFSDDFVLTNDQGVTVRMNAAGQASVDKTGEAAAGRNAAQIEVERKISQTADGYGVDYIIRSTGIDERGIPGVRIASVEGLLMETDPFGRYHLVGVNGGRWERGRHFILKVDPNTLPAGAEFTTSNPLLRRVTPGLPVRFDFGVQLNPEFMAGEQKTAEIELGSVLFAAGSTEIRSQYLGEQGVIAQVAAKLQQYRGGELLISANGESEAVAFARAEAVRKAVTEQLPAEVQAATKVSVRRDVNDANSLISGVTANGAVLGNVLFETDQSVVRPEYQVLLVKVAAYLNAQGVSQGAAQGASVVSIVGHTDVRASHAYNQKLGLARAKAVYEALLPHLSEDLKKHLQVQAEADNASAHRPVPKAASH
ncbi:CshA/CshB family fibrillar adhesin-related protein [Comamonas sp.]|uniref:CshA/CshB family fibrillar adhesin-related protein n=1 Tax=Comamonas sp. TaxID=34028 RepID=UPI002FC5FF08